MPQTVIAALRGECSSAAIDLSKQPFLLGICDGSLEKIKFARFLFEDSVYLKTFAAVLEALVAKTRDKETQIGLSHHVKSTVAFASSFREIAKTLLPKTIQVDDDDHFSYLCPTLYAYANHLSASSTRSGALIGIAAILPCYWVYEELGRQLTAKPEAYTEGKRWVKNLSGEDSVKHADEITKFAEREWEISKRDERLTAVDAFRRSLYYEHKSFDAFWAYEAWYTPSQYRYSRHDSEY